MALTSKASHDDTRYNNNNNNTEKNMNKKRTKASRACDQCRKKKIKCDYNDTKAICTHCSRNNEACTFERVPLKRGPSKGYHKNTTKKNKNNSTIVNDTVVNSIDSLVPSNNLNTITSVFNNTNNESLNLLDQNNNTNTANKIIPRTPSRSNSTSILLPPLSQYMPPSAGGRSGSTTGSNINTNHDTIYQGTTNNNVTNTTNNNASTTNNNNNNNNNFGVLNMNNSSALPNFNLGQQQFWKVPYHEFSHQRKGSIDSLSSDISVRNVNHQDQFFMNTANQQNGTTSINNNNSNKKNSTPGYNNSIGSGSTTGSNYWSFFKSTANNNNTIKQTNTNNINNNVIGTNLNNLNTSNDDTQSERSRGSSLIPSILRQTSNSIIMGQPQLPPPSSSPALQPQNTYSYFQFQQQQLQSLNNTNGNNNNNNNTNTNTNNTNPATNASNTNYNPSINMFSQYATTGFQSRNNSITSDAMSPSSPAIYQSNLKPNMIQGNVETDSKIQQQTLHNRNENIDYNKNNNTKRELSPSNNGLRNVKIHRNSSVASIDSLISNNDVDTNNNNIKSSRNGSNSINGDSVVSDSSVSKPDLHKKKIDNTVQQSDTTISAAATNTPNPNTNTNATSVRSSGNIILYGQISDIELIDIYYEFIHVGFPIIPLNKRTLTNAVLLINTQPISSIHELNNYVILWFRNSLELLVRVALKKENQNEHFFDNNFINPFDKFRNSSAHQNNNSNTAGSTNTGPEMKQNGLENDENLQMKSLFEVQSIFIAALNECFQKIVDVHPKFRENRDIISPKIKIIYLSTFLILNYILGYVGYDNSFVLGMSVTIFNEFNLYKLLILPNDDKSGYNSIFRGSYNDKSTGSIDSSIDENERRDNLRFEKETLIVFKRLYISLIIFDSLQSCTFGGPKLLNVSIDNHMINSIFKNSDDNIGRKWSLDEDPVRLQIILQNLKLGVLLSQLSMNKISLKCFNNSKNADLKNLIWLPDRMRKCVENWTKENESDALPHHVVDHKQRNSEASIASNISDITTVASLFSAVIQTKQYLINYLISINEKNDPNFNMTIDMTEVIADTLCSLLKQILKLLTLIMRTNSINSIDPNNKPSMSRSASHLGAHASNNVDDNTEPVVPSIPTVNSMTMNASTPNIPPSGRSTTPITNDFYQKLLGLDGDGTNSSGSNKGMISPFGISIYHELYNMTNIIKQLPTVLIRVVMKISYTDNMKAQAQVVKLSNSLNEVVQIVSLLGLLKPFKMFESESLKEKTLTMDGEFHPDLSLKWKYINKNDDIYANVDVASNEWIISRFIDVGWMLLDDAELGWYQ